LARASGWSSWMVCWNSPDNSGRAFCAHWYPQFPPYDSGVGVSVATGRL